MGVLRVAMYDVSASLPPIIFSAECCLFCRPENEPPIRGPVKPLQYGCLMVVSLPT
jgi:hypothetical protein